mgnify:CR=1 FL=1
MAAAEEIYTLIYTNTESVDRARCRFIIKGKRAFLLLPPALDIIFYCHCRHDDSDIAQKKDTEKERTDVIKFLHRKHYFLKPSFLASESAVS